MRNLKPAALTADVYVLGVLERRPTRCDGGIQCVVDGLMQTGDLDRPQRVAQPVMTQSGSVQRLVGIDVADAGDDALIEQQRLELA